MYHCPIWTLVGAVCISCQFEFDDDFVCCCKQIDYNDYNIFYIYIYIDVSINVSAWCVSL